MKYFSDRNWMLIVTVIDLILTTNHHKLLFSKKVIWPLKRPNENKNELKKVYECKTSIKMIFFRTFCSYCFEKLCFEKKNWRKNKEKCVWRNYHRNGVISNITGSTVSTMFSFNNLRLRCSQHTFMFDSLSAHSMEYTHEYTTHSSTFRVYKFQIHTDLYIYRSVFVRACI